jgi:hypothetical protein
MADRTAPVLRGFFREALSMSLPSFSSSRSESVFSSASNPGGRARLLGEQHFESPAASVVSSGVSSSGQVESGGLAWLLAYGLDTGTLAQMEAPALITDAGLVYDDPQVCQAWREAQRYYRVSGGPGGSVLSGSDLGSVFEVPRVG